jgi:hypothetical protein
MPPRSATPPSDDAYLAITTVGPWVNNADTKIGLLATALTVLTAGVVRQRHTVETVIDTGVGWRAGIALCLLGVCVVALVIAGACLFKALKPRLTNAGPSRFAFPHLADADLDELARHDPEAIRREAWLQAKTLAGIVRDKYRCFSNALTWGVVSGIAFVGWLLVVPA